MQLFIFTDFTVVTGPLVSAGARVVRRSGWADAIATILTGLTLAGIYNDNLWNGPRKLQ